MGMGSSSRGIRPPAKRWVSACPHGDSGCCHPSTVPTPQSPPPRPPIPNNFSPPGLFLLIFAACHQDEHQANTDIKWLLGCLACLGRILPLPVLGAAQQHPHGLILPRRGVRSQAGSGPAASSARHQPGRVSITPCQAGRMQPAVLHRHPAAVPRQAITVSYSCPRRPCPRQSISQQGQAERADGIAEPGASTASLTHGVPVGSPPALAPPPRGSAPPVARSQGRASSEAMVALLLPWRWGRLSSTLCRRLWTLC